MYKYILFDLDGTLSDPGEGIKESLRYAIDKAGYKVPDEDTLNLFIGPPYTWALPYYCGMNEEDTKRTITFFTEHHSKTGCYKNYVYEGIPELLSKCRENGINLCVASSKPQALVDDVMRFLKLEEYFDVITGAKREGVDYDKVTLINNTLAELAVIEDPGLKEEALKDRVSEMKKHAVMIGDRRFDVEGAINAGVDIIGVGYGYAPEGELEEAGAVTIADSVEELEKLLII